MCPDRQILSLYIDEELPEPWKGKMDAHLERCGGCRASLEQYRLISGRLREQWAEKSLPEGASSPMEAAKERIWASMTGITGSFSQRAAQGRTAGAVWRRSVPVPLPLAAAAAAALVIACMVLFSRPAPGQAPDAGIAAAGASMDIPEIIPASDMNGVLEYLSANEPSDIVIIKFPEGKKFSSPGAPTIMKAADYSRRPVSP